MITWHARVYNLRKYRPTTANYIKLGKSGTRRSPDLSTAAKWGSKKLDALRALFNGNAWLPPGLEPTG